MGKGLRHWIGLIALTMLAACTTNPNTIDPYESINRKVFTFNQSIDHAVFSPAAEFYQIVTPPPLQLAAHNFFHHLNGISYIANDILQLRLGYAIADIWRFVINSTLGLAGMYDVAQNMGLPEHKGQNFGNTLAVWGWHDSAYVVLPFLGPSTVRDSLAVPFDDWFADIPRWITPIRKRNQFITARFISQRAHLLPMNPIIAQAFDPYVFVRNAYLQRRKVVMNNQHYYGIFHDNNEKL